MLFWKTNFVTVKKKNLDYFLCGIIFLFIFRIFLNAHIPLMDKTEARYAEISRIMLETGNWITLQIDYSVPFWAKPPLSTWLSAASMHFFRINEFAARLPSLIASLILVIFVSGFAKNRKSPYIAGFILMTTPEFFLHAGVVSTDTLLSFCVTMTFLSFWKAMGCNKANYWGYLVFVFIGLGILTKGPIAVLLTAPPIIIWIIYFHEYKKVFRQIPLALGSALTLAISLPWYYLAEIETEGFIEYFIVGEHFRRFFDSGWRGDKYGFPKSQPIGIVWLFLFAFAFPWVQFLFAKIWRQRKDILIDKWLLLLILWLLWIPLFFTFSKSLIHPYILPAIVPIALLVDYFWGEMPNKMHAIVLSLIIPTMIIGAVAVGFVNNNLEYWSNTDKYLLQKADLKDKNIYYLGVKSYSSQFYSLGKIQSITYESFQDKLIKNECFEVIIPIKLLENLNDSLMDKIDLLYSNKYSILGRYCT